MQTHELKRRTKNKKSRLIGRGGKRGTTSGRGTKGQLSRAGRKVRPEIRDRIKKLPKLRGRGKNSNRPIGSKAAVVNLGTLNRFFVAGETITPAILLKKKIIRHVDGQMPAVKILAGGLLDKDLIIENCLVSAAAQTAIKKTGGRLI